MLRAVLTVVLLAAAPAAAAAQACVGGALDGMGLALAATLASNQRQRALGAELTGRADFPLWAQGSVARVDLDGLDQDLDVIAGRAGIEYRFGDVSICPGMGIEHASMDIQDPQHGSLELSETALPFFLGVGLALVTEENSVLTVHATPQIFISRAVTVALPPGAIVHTRTEENSTEFGTALGIQLRRGRLFGGAGLQFTTVENADPLFNLQAGVVLARRRTL